MLEKTASIIEKRIADLNDDDIRHFQTHPEELDLISSREMVQTKTLMRLVLLAIAFVAGSKLVAFRFGDELGQFINDVVVDLVFELGAALLGAAATVYFLEMQQKKQFSQNMEFIRTVRKRMEQLDSSQKQQSEH